MAEFTKGPWIVDRRASTRIADSKDVTVANTTWHIDFEKAQANAKLISAAPELYEALRDIRMNNKGSEERQRGWDNALIALEKAEGKR